MDRYGGPAGGVAAFALTAGLACDAGGFNAVSWDRALVALCALALVLVIVGAAARPNRTGAVLLAALAVLTAWTAASWLWSDSPPSALVEAQRTALYLLVAAVVVLAGRHVRPDWLAAGVVAGATLVAVWNLVARIRGVAQPSDLGAMSQPVGYANSLALLCVLGILLLPQLPRLALPVAVPLAIVLVLQHSVGADGALAAGVLVLAYRRARVVVLALAVCLLLAAPFALRGHERVRYWRVAVAETQANPAIGSGAGTFHDWWLRERTVPGATQEAHSLYLETLAELGPIGLAALLSALAVPIAAALRGERPALAAALVAYAVGAAVDFHWELAGVTAPAFLLAATAATEVSPSPPLRRRATVAPVLAALTVAVLLAYAGSARLQSARDALARGDRSSAAVLARSALTWAPFSADAWQVLGDAEGSTAAYRRAVELDPNDWSSWLRLAEGSRGAARRHAAGVAARLNPLASGR